jgi:excisionase family DNA binding protein
VASSPTRPRVLSVERSYLAPPTVAALRTGTSCGSSRLWLPNPNGRPCEATISAAQMSTEVGNSLTRGENNRAVVEMAARRGRLLTTEQTAQLLAVSVRTVKNLVCGGKLAYVKIGRATRFDPDDIDEYILRSRRKERRPFRSIN